MATIDTGPARTHGPLKPWLLLAGGVTAAALLLLAGWHYWTIAGNLLGARDDLLAIERQLRDLGLDIEQSDLDAAHAQIESAETRLNRARSHMDRDPLLALAGTVPAVGEQVDAAHHLVEMAAIVVALGDEASSIGEQIVDAREATEDGTPLTASLVDLLAEAGPQLDRVSSLVDALVAERFALGDSRLLPPLADARAQIDEQLPGLASVVERALYARESTGPMLGFNGERRYFVIALNDLELLPGGGLVSTVGVMTVRDGVPVSMDMGNTGRWKPDWDELGGPFIEPPGPLKRYLLRDWPWTLGTTAWSPDFPTWAQQTIEIYSLVYGDPEVDGVVAVDLHVLEALIGLTGPQVMDIPGYGEVTFDEDNAVLELERVTRQPFERGQDKKAPVGDLATQVIFDVLRLPADRWVDLAETVQRLGDERHLQLLFFDPREQTLVRDLGWSGSLETPGTDFVHFSEASVNSTKLNLLVQPEGAYRIEVSELGDARHELRLRYHNPLPEWRQGRDPELVSRLMLGGVYGGYLRVLAPDDAVGFAVELDGSPHGIEDQGMEGAYRWFGTFLHLPAGETREVAMRWSVPFASHATAGSSYELYIQKQPGTDGVCLEIEVATAGGGTAPLEIEGGRQDGSGRTCLTTDVVVRADLG